MQRQLEQVLHFCSSVASSSSYGHAGHPVSRYRASQQQKHQPGVHRRAVIQSQCYCCICRRSEPCNGGRHSCRLIAGFYIARAWFGVLCCCALMPAAVKLLPKSTWRVRVGQTSSVADDGWLMVKNLPCVCPRAAATYQQLDTHHRLRTVVTIALQLYRRSSRSVGFFSEFSRCKRESRIFFSRQEGVPKYWRRRSTHFQRASGLPCAAGSCCSLSCFRDAGV